MSRFLKFIVHLVIVLVVLDVMALAIPPFLGINTTIVSSEDQETNLPFGSVTYAKKVNVDQLQVGDSVVIQQDGAVYSYRINSMDEETGIYQVYDRNNVEAGVKSYTLRNTALRQIITVGYIGYLIIATQSTEGMMIIGLAILFLIILFILSELWKKDNSLPKEGEEAMDSQPEAQKELSPRQRKKALKKELKRRQKEEDRLDKEQAKQELKDATRQLKAEAKERKKEKKRKRKEAKKRARTGGFIEDYNPIEAKEPQKKEKIQSVPEENVAADEANEFLKREIAATTEHLEEPGQVILDADIRQYIEKPSQAPQVEEEPKAEPAGPIHLAIPRYTEEELLQKAKEAGEDPVVLRDDVWGITLLDYSNIIIEGSEENS